jgi:pyruvate-formate lyase
MSEIARNIFAKPRLDMLRLLKTLTYKYAWEDKTKKKGDPKRLIKFGFQYMPGCGTFENYADFGAFLGASFDGRKKGQAVAEDYAPQNFLLDIPIGDTNFEWNSSVLEHVLKCYAYEPRGPETNAPISKDKVDPEFFSGAVLDINIDEDYPKKILTDNIQQFAKGMGPNMITISTGSRELLIDARTNTERDLIRFRMGGWTEFAVAMFPHLLEHHIRRRREIP